MDVWDIIFLALYAAMIFLAVIPFEFVPVLGNHFWGFIILGAAGIIVTVISFFMLPPPLPNMPASPLILIIKVLKFLLFVGGIIYFVFVAYTYSPLVGPLQETISGFASSVMSLFNEQAANAQQAGNTATDIANTAGI